MVRDPVPPSPLRAARLLRGFKAADLAKTVGVCRMTLWRFESGLRQPTTPTRRALSDALGAKEDDLFAKVGK